MNTMKTNFNLEINKIKKMMFLNEVYIPGNKVIFELIQSLFPNVIKKEGEDFIMLTDEGFMKNLKQKLKSMSDDLGLNVEEIEDFFRIIQKNTKELSTALKNKKQTAEDFANTLKREGSDKQKFIKYVNAINDNAISVIRKNLAEQSLDNVENIKDWMGVFRNRLLKKMDDEKLKINDSSDITEKMIEGLEDSDKPVFKDWPEYYELFANKFKEDGVIIEYMSSTPSQKAKFRLGNWYRRSLFNQILDIWELQAKNIFSVVKKLTDEKLQARWDKEFNQVMSEYQNNALSGNINSKILIDKFLEFGKVREQLAWDELLVELEKRAKTQYPDKQNVISKIFADLKSTGKDDGLEFIIKSVNDNNPKNINDWGKRQFAKLKEWFWEFKTPPKLADGSMRKVGLLVLQFLKKLVRVYFTGTFKSPTQYRIYMARLGYTKTSAVILEFQRQFVQKVWLPALTAAIYYAFAYFPQQMERATGDEYSQLENDLTIRSYVTDNVLSQFTISELFDENPSWIDASVKFTPGKFDNTIRFFTKEGETETEKGNWKFKDENGSFIKNEDGSVLVVKDINEALEIVKDNPTYICASDNKRDCIRLRFKQCTEKSKLITNQVRTYKKYLKQNENYKLVSDDLLSVMNNLQVIMSKKYKTENAINMINDIAPYFVFTDDTQKQSIAYTKNLKPLKIYFNNIGKLEAIDDTETKYKGDIKMAEFGKYVYDRRNNLLSINTVTEMSNQESPECFSIDEKFSTLTNESIDPIINKLIKEMEEGKKFGEDNFKHWKDTFKFKKYDEKTGQLKDVKITSKMDEIMDRIDHFRKKYDEDDSFVRAVIDVFGTGIDVIQYTKGLAHLTEGVIVEGLMGVLANIRESKELVTWTVKHYKDGNWELVKGNFNKKELLNVGKTKRERDERQKESDNPADGLKKKEQESIMILSRDEKEGLNGLPTKIKEKVKEKLRQGWTTEKPFDFLDTYYTESEINSVFNDKIKIYKLKPSAEFFRTLAKNSSKITVKKGFCKSVKNAKGEYDLSEKEKNTLNHFISKCETKFGV